MNHTHSHDPPPPFGGTTSNSQFQRSTQNTVSQPTPHVNSLALNYLPSKFSRPTSSHDESLRRTPSPSPRPSSEVRDLSTANRHMTEAPWSKEDAQRSSSLFARLSGSRSPVAILGEGARKLRSRMPKRGGGRDAFRAHEMRMPNADDEDYDGVDAGISKEGRSTWREVWGRGMRWNRFKWSLLVSNTIICAYSASGLILALLTWLNVLPHAGIVRVGNTTELIISTAATTLGLFCSILGYAGILLNNRSFLAVYTFLLWIVFALIVTPGYITYKTRTFNLEGKLNAQWSRSLTIDGRLEVQNQLLCCGYYNPFVEASISQLCYARSTLPGCKRAYLLFQRKILEFWYTACFSLVPLHLCCMLSGLLCSNYVTYRFGKGMMPRAYRLSMSSMAVIMDTYADQLAEQYGPNVVSDIFKKAPNPEATPELTYEFQTLSPREDSVLLSPAQEGRAKDM